MKKLTIDKNHIIGVIRTKWKFMLLEVFVLAALLALDLAMKDYITKFLESVGGFFELIPKFIDLNYSENPGAGFGAFGDNPIALTVVTSIVLAVILVYLAISHKEGTYIRIPLVMIVAGGVGNLVDRIMLGSVRDFFEFTFVDFAIFNTADIFVTIGSIVLIIGLVYMMVQEHRKGDDKFEKAKQAMVYVREEHSGSDAKNFTVEPAVPIEDTEHPDEIDGVALIDMSSKNKDMM